MNATDRPELPVLPERCRFGPGGRFELRPRSRELLEGGTPVALGGRAFDLLLALLMRRDRVVPRGELIDAVWPGRAAAQDAGIELRQSDARVGKAADAQAGRCTHAKQWRRMRREIRKLHTWLGRVIRDVQRKAAEITGTLKTRIETAQRLYEQRRDSKNKVHALHAPEVECIAKGKARTPYEFGVKASVAVTAREGVVVGMRSMPGAPYDGPTLHSQLEQVEILAGIRPSLVLADRGDRGVQPPEGTRLLLSHARTLPKALKTLLQRRQALEPTFGHMKTDGLLARNWLKGSQGDAIHAVLCGAGHNPRLILAHLRVLVLALIALIVLGRISDASPQRLHFAAA